MGGNHVRHRVTGKEANKRERTESMRDSGQAVTEQVEKKHTFTVSRLSRKSQSAGAVQDSTQCSCRGSRKEQIDGNSTM